MAYIRRQSSPVGKVLEVDVINAMRGVYGLGNYENKGVTHVEDFIGGGTETPSSSSNGSVAASSSSKGTEPAKVSSSSAVQPESSSSTAALHSVARVAGFEFHRDGNTLYGSGKIMLFDMNGNLVRSVGMATSSKTEMQLHGLRQGNYVAKCEGKVLQVQIR
jgi:hypothetical protein